ncbi:type II toxin-antitoxin system PemK/MazF family toxin [Cellulomonas sp. Marseille-Q8402]
MTDSIVPAALGDLLADRPWLLALVAGAVLLVLRLLGRAGLPRPRPGEVWFAMVPFRDGTGAKDRPVVVLATRGRTCTVARLTSQDHGARPEYVRAPHVLPGLRKQSWVDLRPMRIHRKALRRRTGDAGRAWLVWYEERARRADA